LSNTVDEIKGTTTNKENKNMHTNILYGRQSYTASVVIAWVATTGVELTLAVHAKETQCTGTSCEN
jgi:hypothetical protein